MSEGEVLLEAFYWASIAAGAYWLWWAGDWAIRRARHRGAWTQSCGHCDRWLVSYDGKGRKFKIARQVSIEMLSLPVKATAVCLRCQPDPEEDTLNSDGASMRVVVGGDGSSSAS